MPDPSFVIDTPSAVAIAGVAYAEAICGQWAARCPRPDCANAMPLIAGQDIFVCDSLGGCGFVADIVWPPDPQAIEAILMMRPVFTTRNWLLGETLEDLLAENAAHGCLPPEMLTAAPGERPILLRTADQVAVGGLLHQQLEAAGRRQIGA
jgi:hypothetical protein